MEGGEPTPALPEGRGREEEREEEEEGGVLVYVGYQPTLIYIATSRQIPIIGINLNKSRLVLDKELRSTRIS